MIQTLCILRRCNVLEHGEVHSVRLNILWIVRDIMRRNKESRCKKKKRQIT